MNAYAPVTVDFANKFNKEVEDVAVVFTVLTISYMLGALLSK